MIKAFIIFAALLGTETKENYKVSTEESTVEWVGKKVTGQHNGVISLQGGRLEMVEGQLVGGIFTIDMTTITDTDLSGGSKEKLEGHLKSDDFFGVEKFPTATFVITKAVPQGPGKYKIIGNITIKGKTEEIQFPATIEEKDGKMVASADLSIDRSKFDVRYGSGSFFDNLGDKTIYDNFDLSISLVASK
ncbi:YceI family protein [Ekhidna sp. To15]|uniref:YceI family protein n=1 Tax=Ekhidna sp. To15 TaxID=3395267 RepID=UPI003F520893